MYCRHCGKEITEDAKFCPNCGKAQSYEVHAPDQRDSEPVNTRNMVKCPDCGKWMAKSAHICPHCGSKKRYNLIMTVCGIIMVIAMYCIMRRLGIHIFGILGI